MRKDEGAVLDGLHLQAVLWRTESLSGSMLKTLNLTSGHQIALAPTAPAVMTSRPQGAEADRFQISLKVGSTVGLISDWKLSVFQRFPLLSQRLHL